MAEAKQIEVEGDLVQVTEEEDIDLLKVPVSVKKGDGSSKEHQRILNKLGLYGGQKIHQLDLESYLKKNGYEVYPIDSVNKYMNKKVVEMKPKRQHKRYSWSPATTYGWKWVSAFDYKQVIPLEVLMTIEKIHNDLGESVEFYVTDVFKKTQRARSPMAADPFLAVGTPDTPKYIIERWDEPAFRR